MINCKKGSNRIRRLDRIKLETGRKSALFERDENEIILKGAFARLKTSDELRYIAVVIVSWNHLQ